MISTRLATLLRTVLALEEFDFRDDTKAFQVPGWDSLRHVEILTTIEKEYGIRIRTLEALRLKSVGDLQVLIDQKGDPNRRVPG
jgi:acyl carrier protein